MAGFFIFSSASLGLITRDGPRFDVVALKQLFGLILGIVVFFIISRVRYDWWKKYSLVIFIGAIVLNLLVFIPGLALHHGGASRWIDLGIISFQPSEFLKIAFIIYFAAWISHVRDKIATVRYGLVPYLVIVCVLALVILAQSDTDTLLVIAMTGLVMLYVGGGKKRHIGLVVVLMILGLIAIVYTRPYILNRIKTFIDPTADEHGTGFQIRQSLIAIGSGGFAGKGFGQSVQKFNYLPEPIGDSIFAVWAEEFGFVGSVVLVVFFILFLISSLKIAARAPDSFGGLIATGIAILIVVESFVNISAMLGIIPLSGMPLLFVSHGGTALLTTLGATGIIASISRHQSTHHS